MMGTFNNTVIAILPKVWEVVAGVPAKGKQKAVKQAYAAIPQTPGAYEGKVNDEISRMGSAFELLLTHGDSASWKSVSKDDGERVKCSVAVMDARTGEGKSTPINAVYVQTLARSCYVIADAAEAGKQKTGDVMAWYKLARRLQSTFYRLQDAIAVMKINDGIASQMEKKSITLTRLADDGFTFAVIREETEELPKAA